MRVRSVDVTETHDGARLRAVIGSNHAKADGFILEYRYRDLSPNEIQPSGDAFVPALLLPSMSLGEDLVLDFPVSPTLLEATETLMHIYSAWFEIARPIKVLATPEVPRTTGEGVGLFFSGGVDSFQALLGDKRRHPPDGSITHLLFVRGFEHFEREDTLFGRIESMLRRVGDESGKSVLVIESNIRSLTDPLVPHGMYHVADLVSVGLTLAPLVRGLKLAAGVTYQHLYPGGTHPLIDPLWSTEAVQVAPVGLELQRFQKVQEIAQSQLALDNLLVCRESRSAYNCGGCPKCAYAMIALTMAGALDRCATLPHEIDRSLLEMLESENRIAALEASVADVNRERLDPRFERVLERHIATVKAKIAFAGLVRALRVSHPGLARVLEGTWKATKMFRRG
jgi:hypothetical protein